MKKKAQKKSKGLVPRQDDDASLEISRAIELAKTELSNTPPESLTLLAFEKMRDELNVSALSSMKHPDQWTVKDIVYILETVEKFIENTMSAQSDEGGDVIIINVHPAALALNSFVRTLNDIDEEILEKRLRQKIGNRLTSLERKTIGIALTCVKINQRQKGVSLKQARENVAKHLKKLGIKVGRRPISAAGLKEWSKDYDLNGRKKEGK